MEKSLLPLNSHRALDLEIGSGVGFFAIHYAKTHPERDLISIEKTKEKYEKFKRRVEHHPPLLNLQHIHANAIDWSLMNLPNESIQKCFILYPNPYPKKNALNKRFYAMPIMVEFLKKLKNEGELIVATNEPDYQKKSEYYFTQKLGLIMKEKNTYQKEQTPFFKPRTHFEKKYFERGEICFENIFKRSFTP